ncbi:unnamed protein product [Nippostrongylus brasiliensis]|uniref:t-SNARE coiled-coil homology domain-containing protein n=1 Tax=Nippostrongylus brasiliensis TaxID=27835 RepID=A0A0N4XI28_NIPBR|nr:unnamed protein product [Nippostrongylus brasiliensis]
MFTESDYEIESPDLSLHDEPHSPPHQRRQSVDVQGLRAALQFLPDAGTLCSQIADTVLQLESLSTSISCFHDRVKKIGSADMPFTIRLDRLKYLELWCDKLKVEVRAIRSRLQTQFAVPPILIALGHLSSDVCMEMLDREAYREERMPLRLNQQLLERRISEELTELDRQRDYITQYLQELNAVDREEQVSFQRHVSKSLVDTITALQSLQNTADDTQMMVVGEREKIENRLDTSAETIYAAVASAVATLGRGEPTPSVEQDT